MSDDPALVAAQRLAAMEVALAAGALQVTFRDGTRTNFGSAEEMRAMLDAMRAAANGVRVRFRPRSPAGSRNEMPTAWVALPDAVKAALNGVGVILDAEGGIVAIALLRNPKSPPGFLRDVRTR